MGPRFCTAPGARPGFALPGCFWRLGQRLEQGFSVSAFRHLVGGGTQTSAPSTNDSAAKGLESHKLGLRFLAPNYLVRHGTVSAVGQTGCVAKRAPLSNPLPPPRGREGSEPQARVLSVRGSAHVGEHAMGTRWPGRRQRPGRVWTRARPRRRGGAPPRPVKPGPSRRSPAMTFAIWTTSLACPALSGPGDRLWSRPRPPPGFRRRRRARARPAVDLASLRLDVPSRNPPGPARPAPARDTDRSAPSHRARASANVVSAAARQLDPCACDLERALQQRQRAGSSSARYVTPMPVNA